MPDVCPHGFTADNYPKSRASRQVGTANETNPELVAMSKARYEICKTCECAKDGGHGCELVKGCCFGRKRTDPQFTCPQNKWPQRVPTCRDG